MKLLIMITTILKGLLFLQSYTIPKEKNEESTTTPTTIPVYSVIICTLNNGNITTNYITAKSGTIINLTIIPSNGYKLKSGTLTFTKTSGSPQTIEGASFTMPAGNATVNAEFEAIIYTITISSVTSGTIKTDKTNAKIGTVINFTNISPSSIYHTFGSYLLKYILADGGSKTFTGNEKSFTMPASNVVVDVTFRLFQIGDTGPAGGRIFYDKGLVNDGWRFLEAAKKDLAELVKFSSSCSCAVSTGSGIGTGKTNTVNLKTDSNVTIVQLFYSYNYGGFTDWFLPSIDELSVLMSLRTTYPDMNLNLPQDSGSNAIYHFRASSTIIVYLLSSFGPHDNKCYQNFHSNNEYMITSYLLNYSFFYVRAIRQF